MKKYRILTATTVALAAFALTACSTGSGNGDAEGGNEGSDSAQTISWISGVAADSAYVTAECAAIEAGEAAGYTVNIQAPQKWDVTLQRPIVDSVIASRPAGIIIAPVDTSAFQRPLEDAAESGIPVVLFDTTTDDPSFAVSHVATDNLAVGAAGFEAIKEAHPDGGKVWILGSAPGVSTGDERIQGFKDAAAKDPNFELVEEQYGQDDTSKSAQLTSATIQANPDLVGIFAVSYKESQGASTSVKQAGLDELTLVSVDADPGQIEALKADQIQVLIAQDFAQIGKDSVEQLIKAINGEETTAIQKTSVTVITQDNVDTPEAQAAIYKTSC